MHKYLQERAASLEQLQLYQKELNRLRGLVEPVSIHCQNFTVGGQLDWVVIGHGGRRYGLAGPRSVIMGWQPRPGNGAYTFSYNSDVYVLSVRLNGNDVGRGCIHNDRNVNYHHTYPLANGTAAVFEVFLRECDIPTNRQAIVRLENDINRLTQSITNKDNDVTNFKKKLADEQSRFNDLQTKRDSIITILAKIFEESKNFDTYSREIHLKITQINKLIEIDSNECLSFRSAKKNFLLTYKQISELLNYLGRNFNEFAIFHEALRKMEVPNPSYQQSQPAQQSQKHSHEFFAQKKSTQEQSPVTETRHIFNP